MERYDGQAIWESGKWATYKQAATELVEDYAARMERDYRRAGGTDESMLIGCFIQRLLPVLKDKLIDRQPLCVSDAITLAKYYERNFSVTPG